MTYLEEITKAIEWYRNIGTPDPEKELIDKLLKVRRRLACNLFLIRKDVAAAKEAKEKAYFERKRYAADRYLALKAANWTGTDAEKKTILDSNAEGYETRETQATRIYEDYRLLMDTVGEVLNALSTDIKALENEYRRSNQTD